MTLQADRLHMRIACCAVRSEPASVRTASAASWCRIGMCPMCVAPAELLPATKSQRRASMMSQTVRCTRGVGQAARMAGVGAPPRCCWREESSGEVPLVQELTSDSSILVRRKPAANRAIAAMCRARNSSSWIRRPQRPRRGIRPDLASVWAPMNQNLPRVDSQTLPQPALFIPGRACEHVARRVADWLTATVVSPVRIKPWRFLVSSMQSWMTCSSSCPSSCPVPWGSAAHQSQQRCRPICSRRPSQAQLQQLACCQPITM